MLRPTLRRLIFAAAAAPLALALVACGDKDADKPGGLSGEPIAKVAPPASKAWTEVVAKTPEGGMRMGNPDAPIKLVEYGSMTCSHCAEFSEQASAGLRDEFVSSGRVSYEFRNFVRDPIDLTVAMLARCGSPESFFPLTEQAFAYQPAMMEKAQKAGEATYTAALNQPEGKRYQALADLTGLTEFFAARGIAKDQAGMCLVNAAEAQSLAKHTQEQTEQYKIEGTPTFLVNGQSIGSMEWPELRTKLQTMGAR
jgi:protein-disulfide isomerase